MSEAKNITGHTLLYCLIGSAVAHSMSPAMHNASFSRLGIDACYVAFAVNLAKLETAVEGLRQLGVKGWNVTMPDKNRMAQLCDELGPASSICQTVNTVKNENGVLKGITTDGTGWVECARALGHNPTGKNIVQLGAGGAGTSILVQTALDRAKHIAVFNAQDTFWPKVEEIVAKLNKKTACQVELHDIKDLDTLRKQLTTADVLLNTTPVGMNKIPGCLIPDATYLHKDLIVSDIIYEPKETALLKMAKETGCQTFNGTFMLLYQGAASFKFWTGQDMPLEEIKTKYFNK